MRIAVLEILARGEEGAGVAQVRADRAVGRVELLVDDRSLAAEPEPVLAIAPVILDREDGVDAVRLAQQEIVLAMVGRHVNQAGARLGGDEIAGEERAGFSEERSEEHTSELQSLMRISYAVFCLHTKHKPTQ